MNTADSTKSRDMGRMLLTIGLAVAGSTMAFAVQYGGMQQKIQSLESHEKLDMHPPKDYRSFIENRINRLEGWQTRHDDKHYDEK